MTDTTAKPGITRRSILSRHLTGRRPYDRAAKVLTEMDEVDPLRQTPDLDAMKEVLAIPNDSGVFYRWHSDGQLLDALEAAFNDSERRRPDTRGLRGAAISERLMPSDSLWPGQVSEYEKDYLLRLGDDE